MTKRRSNSDVHHAVKRQIVKAIDFRLSGLTGSVEVLKKAMNESSTVIADYDSRIDELKSLRKYIRNCILFEKGKNR